MPHTIVISDGSLPALVAACLAAEEAREGEAVGLWAVRPLADDGGGAAERAVQAHAELLGAEIIDADDPSGVPPTPAGGAPTASGVLLHAATAAAAAGASRLIWPEVAAGDLERMAREADRALLISRLVGLDEAAPARFEIETPLLDLTDEQVAELALDLDAPVWRCWWWSIVRGAEEAEAPVVALARAQDARWTGALRRVGWAEAFERASITSG